MKTFRETVNQSSIKIYSEDIKIYGKYRSSFIQVINTCTCMSDH